jgi:ubiquitin-like protein Pup
MRRESAREHSTTQQVDDGEIVEIPPPVDKDKLKKDLDDVLDEIDAVLDENEAMHMVKEFVQKGGE